MAEEKVEIVRGLGLVEIVGDHLSLLMKFPAWQLQQSPLPVLYQPTPHQHASILFILSLRTGRIGLEPVAPGAEGQTSYLTLAEALLALDA